ncbi:MAG: HTH domain-containing protein [Clostridiales bacterium]|nr:HTH domain-containing protein [Clostridiales bacterium]
MLDFYGKLLTDKQLEVMELYYNQDLSLTEIAENLNVTRQAVHDAIKKSEKSLKEYENKLNLVVELGDKIQFFDKLEKVYLAYEKISKDKEASREEKDEYFTKLGLLLSEVINREE